MTSPIKIGVVGAGFVGGDEATYVDESDRAELVGIADPDSELADEFDWNVPWYDDHDELYDRQDPDAVIVATPHTEHYQQAKTALKQGRDVLVEKPLSVTYENVADLAECAAGSSGILRVGYQRRFHPGYRAVRASVRDGELGQLHTISWSVGQSWRSLNEGKWRTAPDVAGGGQLYDMGSHVIETLLWVTGATPEAVTATMDSRGTSVEVNSALTLSLRADGQTITAAMVVCGDSTSLDPEETISIWGSAGRLRYTKDPEIREMVETLELLNESGTTVTEFDEGIDYYTLTRRKVRQFIDECSGGSSELATGEFCKKVAAVRSGAQTSWNTGEQVDINSDVN